MSRVPQELMLLNINHHYINTLNIKRIYQGYFTVAY